MKGKYKKSEGNKKTCMLINEIMPPKMTIGGSLIANEIRINI
jgi:hypothetical protein